MMTELETDITERRRVEEALRESEDRHRAMFEQAADSIVLVDAETGALVQFNDRAHQSLGYSREEFAKLKISDFEVIESPEEVAKHLEKVVKEGAATFETKHRIKGGEIRDIQVSSRAVTLGGRHFIQGIWRDVTERRRAEEALRESEDRHRAMFEQAADSIVLVDAETGALVQFNDRAHQSPGYSREEFAKLKISDFEVIESPEEVAKHLEKVVKEGAATFETKHRTKGGEIRDIEVRARGLSIQGKDLVQSIWRDITERKRVEEALRESEDRHRAMFEQAADSIVLIDAATGALVQFNDRAHQSLGYSREEFEGLKIPDFEVIQSAEDVAKHIEKIVKEGGETFETKHRAKSGEIRDIQVSSRAVTLGGRHFIQGIWRDVTERRRAEDALRESEARFRKIFEEGPLGMALVGLDFRFVKVNSTLCRIVGYTEQELVALTFSEITHPEDIDKDLGLAQQLFNQEIPYYNMQKRFVKKNGEVVWVDLSASVIPAEDGKPLYGLGMVEDITERKRAEEALRDSEAKYSTLVEQANDGVIIAQDRVFKFMNKAYADIAGYSVHELVGMDFMDTIPPEDRASVAERYEKRLKAERPSSPYEAKLLCKDGTIKDVEFSGASITYEGRPAVMGVARDITERKRAEEALRQSEERFRSLSASAPIGIGLNDAQGKCIYANPRLQTISGLTLEESLGYGWTNVIHPDDREAVLEEASQAPRQGREFSREFRIVTPGGELRWLSVHSTPVVSGGAEQTGRVVMVEDITERKRAEEALRLYAERLRIVHEIDQAILAVQPLEAIAHVALTQIERLLPCQWASVVELEPERNATKMVATRIGGKTKNNRGIRLLPEMFGDIGALRQGKVEVVEDVLALSARPAVIQAFGAEEVRSYVSVPLVSQGELFGCLCLGASRPAAFAPNHIEIAREVADELAIAIQSGRLSQQVRDTRRRLEALSHRLLEVQEAERRHMASELHDEIGQMLTGLQLLLEMGTHLPSDAVRGKLEEAQGLVAELMERVRELSLGLRPAMLDDLGLLPALLWHFERYATQADVRVDFKHAELQRRFRSEVETGAYRIVQEALTNVARHADVSEVVVRIWADRDTLSLQIEDEGTGFDPEAVLAARSTSGLAGMHERAVLLGGQLIVESALGAGTRVTAELPLRPQAEKRPKKR